MHNIQEPLTDFIRNYVEKYIFFIFLKIEEWWLVINLEMENQQHICPN